MGLSAASINSFGQNNETKADNPWDHMHLLLIQTAAFRSGSESSINIGIAEYSTLVPGPSRQAALNLDLMIHLHNIGCCIQSTE